MMKRKSTPVWSESQVPLREWYASALGQSILEQLGTQLDTVLPGIFGYQGLQAGCLADGQSLLAKAGIHRSIILDAPQPIASDANAADSRPLYVPDIAADIESLPIANDVMKVVLFPHTLDFCQQPHQALREADRILTNDGQLLIIGFNPWSMFGLGHGLLGWRQQVPWNGQFYSRNRVTEWLSVLNYRVVNSSAFYLRPPIQSASLLSKLGKIEQTQRWVGGVGGVYLLHARKQTIPMTMSRRRWLRQKSGIAVGSFARVGENRTNSSATNQNSNHRQKPPD